MKNTTLPVLLKGILSPEDAVIAVDIGVAGFDRYFLFSPNIQHSHHPPQQVS